MAMSGTTALVRGVAQGVKAAVEASPRAAIADAPVNEGPTSSTAGVPPSAPPNPHKTQQEAIENGYCLACWTDNKPHKGHLFWGNCKAKGSVPRTAAFLADADKDPESAPATAEPAKDRAPSTEELPTPGAPQQLGPERQIPDDGAAEIKVPDSFESLTPEPATKTPDAPGRNVDQKMPMNDKVDMMLEELRALRADLGSRQDKVDAKLEQHGAQFEALESHLGAQFEALENHLTETSVKVSR